MRNAIKRTAKLQKVRISFDGMTEEGVKGGRGSTTYLVAKALSLVKSATSLKLFFRRYLFKSHACYRCDKFGGPSLK